VRTRPQSWTEVGGILGSATGAMAEAKSCEFVSREPVFVKKIGNFRIDPSEWENEHGAFLYYRETRCRFVAGAGHRYCPRHEMESQMDGGTR
jgi:hypothetical protein